MTQKITNGICGGGEQDLPISVDHAAVLKELETLNRRFGNHKPGLLGARREYAVLCPLLEQPDGLHLLFEVRAAALQQGGEVCFPGGRLEAGETPVDCALRETEEELEIPRSEVTLLGTPDFICNPRGYLLRPVLGLVSAEGMKALKPSPAEVAEAFTVPLEFFQNTAPEMYSYDLTPHAQRNFPYEAVGVSVDYPWSRGRVEVPVWYWHHHVIWGMTARIVREIAAK